MRQVWQPESFEATRLNFQKSNFVPQPKVIAHARHPVRAAHCGTKREALRQGQLMMQDSNSAQSGSTCSCETCIGRNESLRSHTLETEAENIEASVVNALIWYGVKSN